MKEIIIDAKPENLDVLLNFVTSELETAECSMKLQNQIAIAVEEIFVNIAHYAYNPDVGSAVIRITVGDEVVIEFEDKGKPYNPLENSDPDVTLGADERKAGGLGIFMVKKKMDVVEYRHEDNKNLLIIRKAVV